MITLVSRRTKRNVPRKSQRLANTNYASKWAGITQDAPSGVTGSTATRYKSNSSSVSSVAIAGNGTKSFTIETGEGYVVGDHIMVIPDSQPTYYMAGNVTAHNSGTGAISFNVTASNGSGTFASWSLGGTIPDGRNYFGLIKFAGTDSETGFALPTGAPLYANTSTGFCIQFIDWYDGFPTNDAAGFAVSASTDFEQVTIDGVTTTALVIDQKQPVAPIDPVGGYRKQTWAMLYRDVATDLPRLLTSYDLWINDLTGKLSTTNRRVNIWEMKTVDDFRYVCTIIMADATDATEFGVAVGTIGWEIICDNRAASLTVEEFFRYKNFTTPVPTEEFVKFIVFWVRGSYTDETKGRLLIQYKPYDSDDFLTVCDYNYQSNIGYNSSHPLQAVGNSPDTDNRNIHMGVNGGAPHRIFFCGVYGKYEQTSFKVKCANLEFHDNYLPPTLASAAVILEILNGPQSYVATIPTGVVKYVSPTGTGVGTFTDPMSIADANDGALPGDHFWLRGGTYAIPLNGIRFYEGGTSWAPGKYVTYESYPGEQAVFDGAANQAEEADVRVKFQNAFVCLRKVEIKNCSLQGVEMSGTDNKIEFCEIHDCWLSGITARVSEAAPFVNGRNIIRSNTIYNCSDVGRTGGGSYANGGNADAISISSGLGNIVEYNRCYNCSDDGIDGWRSTGTIVRYNLVYGMGLGDGNGNGFKCGGSPGGTASSLDQIYAYNISVGNTGAGFAGNNGVRTLMYHNTTSGNAEGFTDFDSTARLIGNIAAETSRYSGSTAGHSGNSWNVSVGTTPTFISTNPSSSDYYKPPAGNVFEDIGAYAA